MPARLYVVGRVWLHTPAGCFSERDMPGRLSRVLLVALTVDRCSPVPRDVLAHRLWDDRLPPAWEASLDSLVSRVRRLLGLGFPDGGACVSTDRGAHQLLLPASTVVDLETAVRSVDAAEGALRRGDVGRAWAQATVASAITRRPLLTGEDGAWVTGERGALVDLHGRSLTCLSGVWTARGDHVLAARMASSAVALDPFRESGYRRLMAALAAAGDRAEALRVYARCRRLLAAELGAEPAPQTQRLHQDLLAGGVQSSSRST